MTTPLRRCATVLVLGVVAAVLAGCSEMSWDEKKDALREAAERGADAHYVLMDQNKEPSKENCDTNYSLSMGRGDDPPADMATGSASREWAELHKDYFVDSCVSGKPRLPHQARPTTSQRPPSTTSAPATTTTS